MKKTFRKIIGALVACWALVGLTAQADVLLMHASEGQLASSSGNNTLGYSFTVNASPLSVTSLGVYDEGVNGLVNPHEVGLWTMGGTLLATALVPSGTAGALIGEFRYTGLGSPVVLSAGQSYVLGVHYLSSEDLDAVRDFFVGQVPAFNPAVTAGNWRWIENGGFTFPVNVSSDPAVVGPSMGFTVVPEPSAAVLAAAGGVLAALWRRHGRSAKAPGAAL